MNIDPKQNRFNYFKIMLISVVLIFIKCTDNPFFSEDSSTANKSIIKGKVELDRSDDPSGVYIWLEKLNISTVTNDKGEFLLQLPHPQSLPGGAAGWNGKLKLYYYLANYTIKHSIIMLQDGEILYGREDVDINGNIKQTVALNAFCHIKAVAKYPYTFDFIPIPFFRIEVEIVNYASSVSYQTYIPRQNLGGRFGNCIIVRRKGDPDDEAQFFLGGCAYTSDRFYSTYRSWHMYLMNTFEPGDYEFIPFVLVEQDSVPQDLLNSISPFYNTFTTEYLKLPVKLELGEYTVE